MFTFLASESLAVALVNGLLLGLVLTAAVWGILRIARRLNAATRYAVLALTLAAVVALPAVYGTLAYRHHLDQEVHLELPAIIVEADRPVLLHREQLRVLEADALEALDAKRHALEAASEKHIIELHQRVLEAQSERLEREAERLEQEVRVLERRDREHAEHVAPIADVGLLPAGSDMLLGNLVATTAQRAPVREAGTAVLFALPSTWFGGPWMPFALAAWAVVALFLIGRIAHCVLRMNSLKHGSTIATLPLQIRFNKHLDTLRIGRDVRLALSDDVAVPLVAGLTRPHVLLPSALVDQLTTEEFDQVVLHELAHVQRWDDWAKLLQKMVEAIFFFHPAVLLLVRDLDREREIACDDQAMRHARGSRKAYASCLARLVELTRWPSVHTLAPGAGSSKEELFDRVRNVLDGTRDSSDRLSRRSLLAAVTAVTAVFVFAAHLSLVTAQVAPPPAPPAPPLPPPAPTVPAPPPAPVTASAPAVLPAPPAPAAIEDLTDERWESSWTENGVKYRVSARGEVTFGDDDRSLARLDRDGSFTLMVKGKGMDRKVEVLPSRSGLAYRYWNNGRRADFDATAQRWLGDTVLRVIRHSGVGAKERALRILRDGGTGALLREIDEIGTDYGKRRYMTVAVEHADLPDDDLARLINAAGRLSSDYEKRQVLQAIAAEHHLTDRTRDAFFDAMADMSSDYEKRQVLTTLVENNPDAATRRAAIGLAQGMGSDYEKRQVLQHAIKRGDSEAMKQEYLEASLTMGSDYERRQVLTQVLQDDATSPALLRLALQGTRDLSSDYEKRQVLEQIASRMTSDRAMYRTYLDLVATLDSDYEKRQVLQSLLQHQTLDNAALVQALEVAAGMGSDHEKRQVLTPIIQRYTAEAYLRPVFFRIVRSMGSAYEQRQLLANVFEADRLPDTALIDAFAIASDMGSDYEKASLLMHAASHLKNASDQVIDAFVKTVEGIDSEHEYNRVVSALSRQNGLRSLLRR